MTGTNTNTILYRNVSSIMDLNNTQQIVRNQDFTKRISNQLHTNRQTCSVKSTGDRNRGQPRDIDRYGTDIGLVSQYLVLHGKIQRECRHRDSGRQHDITVLEGLFKGFQSFGKDGCIG